MSEKLSSNQPRRRVSDSNSKVVTDNKIQGRKDKKPPTADASRPSAVGQAGRERGGRGGTRRDDDRDTRNNFNTFRRDKPLSAKAESYKPVVLKPDGRLIGKDLGKDDGSGKNTGGIPATSSTPLGSNKTSPVSSVISPAVGHQSHDDAGQMKVHFGVIKGMPYEFISNSAESVSPKDIRKYG